VLLNVVVGAAAAALALLRLLPQSPGFHTEAVPAEDSHATFRGTEEDEREDVVTVDAPRSRSALARPSPEAACRADARCTGSVGPMLCLWPKEQAAICSLLGGRSSVQ
jgi:hypothetical protein